MEFWAIGYKYKEGVYYDYATDDLAVELKETCFLPTKEVAEDYIRNEFDDEYVAVKIDLLRLEANGVWAYSSSHEPKWDDF
ncbi:hypothetical protein FJQ98_21020 [Lysinibacillus agricola]|uniref:Uncharacterized protein n=1 Tax=Lysinibacillus agricola TaxID=2590012 RepID=A0ABX7ARW4_9BACI|nr:MULTISPECIES: hypothetical protein [Lysinibacillus]KOS64492.1 hypothetical protein AN161_02065 [Lysinibacillus sp. FJAT-14222]QQP11643.1 hypothetical protein FJQ98_21020 [Lysinibacillus agricola]